MFWPILKKKIRERKEFCESTRQDQKQDGDSDNEGNDDDDSDDCYVGDIGDVGDDDDADDDDVMSGKASVLGGIRMWPS